MSWKKVFVVAEFELIQTARRLGFITMTLMLPLLWFHFLVTKVLPMLAVN